MTDGPISAADVEPRRVGRPLKYGPEIEEQALLQVALAGGSYRRAARELAEQGIDVPEQTLRSWCKGRLRNRYTELCSQSARVLEEEVARRATDLALRISDAEESAIKQTLAGLADANGVEASMILRNLSHSKQVQVDKAGAIRGRATAVFVVEGLDELAGKLARLGAAEIIDGDAEEIADVDLVD